MVKRDHVLQRILEVGALVQGRMKSASSKGTGGMDVFRLIRKRRFPYRKKGEKSQTHQFGFGKVVDAQTRERSGGITAQEICWVGRAKSVQKGGHLAFSGEKKKKGAKA